jgi:hypothetical protein
MRDLDHFGITRDERTDGQVPEQLHSGSTFCGRECNARKLLPKGNRCFADRNGKDTQNIVQTHTKFVNGVELDVYKIGTDAVGCWTAAVIRLKTIAKSATGLHCAAH